MHFTYKRVGGGRGGSTVHRGFGLILEECYSYCMAPNFEVLNFHGFRGFVADLENLSPQNVFVWYCIIIMSRSLIHENYFREMPIFRETPICKKILRLERYMVKVTITSTSFFS